MRSDQAWTSAVTERQAGRMVKSTSEAEAEEEAPSEMQWAVEAAEGVRPGQRWRWTMTVCAAPPARPWLKGWLWASRPEPVMVLMLMLTEKKEKDEVAAEAAVVVEGQGAIGLLEREEQLSGAAGGARSGAVPARPMMEAVEAALMVYVVCVVYAVVCVVCVLLRWQPRRRTWACDLAAGALASCRTGSGAPPWAA